MNAPLSPDTALPRLTPLRPWRPSPLAPPGTRWRGLRGPLWLMLATSLLLQLAGRHLAPGLSDALRYDRAAVLVGQWWRLGSGQLLHLGWAHLALNAIGLIWVDALLGHVWRAWQWALLCLLCALGVSLGLLLWSPQVSWYVGLSGLAHGLAAAGAVALWRNGAPAGRWWLLILAAKLVKEQCLGGSQWPPGWLGGATIVDAHLYGALTGLLVAALLPRRPQPLPPPPPA